MKSVKFRNLSSKERIFWEGGSHVFLLLCLSGGMAIGNFSAASPSVFLLATVFGGLLFIVFSFFASTECILGALASESSIKDNQLQVIIYPALCVILMPFIAALSALHILLGLGALCLLSAVLCYLVHRDFCNLPVVA